MSILSHVSNALAHEQKSGSLFDSTAHQLQRDLIPVGGNNVQDLDGSFSMTRGSCSSSKGIFSAASNAHLVRKSTSSGDRLLPFMNSEDSTVSYAAFFSKMNFLFNITLHNTLHVAFTGALGTGLSYGLGSSSGVPPSPLGTSLALQQQQQQQHPPSATSSNVSYIERRLTNGRLGDIDEVWVPSTRSQNMHYFSYGRLELSYRILFFPFSDLNSFTSPVKSLRLAAAAILFEP